MNSKECVSRGCSLQAAMLSPIFQVRNFDVKDTFPFRVNIHWEKDDGAATSQLFGATEKDGMLVPQSYPCVKSVAFMKTEPFTVTASYSDDSKTPVVRHFTGVAHACGAGCCVGEGCGHGGPLAVL
jgi:heat shock 70kDa protein 4